MAEERAKDGHPFWSYRYGIFPAPGQQYLEWRHKNAARYVAGKKILDVPSGEGLGLKFLGSAQAITCLDYCSEAVESTRRQSSKVVETVCASMMDMPLDSGSFDCVVSLEGLEHVDKRDGVDFLAEVDRVLAERGTFVLSCPVSIEGRHSGNVFHFHEWSAPHLEGILKCGFEIVESTEREGVVGQVVFFVLTKRPGVRTKETWRETFRTMEVRRLHSAVMEAADWTKSCRRENSYSLWSGGAASLLPTCFAVLSLETAANDRAVSRREELVEYICSCQSADTGLFEPGEIHRRELTSHSATYLRLQATYFSIHALDALGRSPKAPIRYTERFLDHSYLRGWLDGGPWQNPWLHSNHIMFALALLENAARVDGNDDAMAAFDSILDYLDERQDPVSGFWQPDDGRDDRNALFAAYHFFPYYYWRRRPVNHVDKIIDSTLAVQLPDGLFGPSGGACEDLDGVHTLVMMSLVTDYRASDVERALERCFWRMQQTQNPDGGFANYFVPPPTPAGWKRRLVRRIGVERLLDQRVRTNPPVAKWKYSGWSQLECPTGASDMWSAWFRPLSLKLIAERYPRLADGPVGGTYRRLPGLGWHDADVIRSVGLGRDEVGLAKPQMMSEAR